MNSGGPPSRTPSSSAVTIPIPGKSILKHPPPPAPTLLSRFSLSRLLPNEKPPQASQDVREDNPLKRAHFILPRLATIYPISPLNPPSSKDIKDEKVTVEKRENERRKRVVRMSSFSSSIGSVSLGSREENKEDWWTLEKVQSFYKECCMGVGEPPDPAILAALKNARSNPPRTLTISEIQLTESSSHILSDILSLEWGLRRLELRDCDLSPSTLKPILHALLLEDSLSLLSLAGHPGGPLVAAGSFHKGMVVNCMLLVGAYVRKSTSLTYLDLSCIPLDNKKSIEYLVQGLRSYEGDKRTAGLQTLKMDDCSLRGSGLEILAKHVRTSTLQHISLRHNKIGASGCVALAMMIRDYPDTIPTALTTFPSTILDSSSPPSTPPPQAASTPLGTTYTPYIPRSRRTMSSQPNNNTIVTATSRAGGITAIAPPVSPSPLHHSHQHQPSEALLHKVRALDNLPRLGCLKTLDLKGNDLRGGIQYLSQVLKRNRTLKTLNLAENKIDEKGLSMIGDALKYNQSLETLDLSRNPCGGPLLDGVQSLRTSLSLSRTLKRLFMTGTNIKSQGAISLAEFLPEAESLLFLGLTQNDLGYAGVLALAESLKKNHVMRCLDLDVPPGDEDFAKMCRDILNSCVRNTEDAEKAHHHSYASPLSLPSAPTSDVASVKSASSGILTSHEIVSKRGTAKGVWSMIEDSELAKGVKLGEDMKDDNDVLVRARACIAQLQALLSASPTTLPLSPSPGRSPAPHSPNINGHVSQSDASAARQPQHLILADLSSKAQSILSELQNAMISSSEEGVMKSHEDILQDEERMASLLDANDALTAAIGRAQAKLDGVVGKPTLTLAGIGLRLNTMVSSSPSSPSLSSGGSSVGFGRAGRTNGHAPSPLVLSSASSTSSDLESDDVPLVLSPTIEEPGEDELLMTPRADKGKGKAEPAVEEHERVLSPIAGLPPEELAKEYFEDDLTDDDHPPDPTMLREPSLNEESMAEGELHDRSRIWVEEEGEVFRRGNVLLSEAEMEGDYAGDELRRELLDAMVERPAPRPIEELMDEPPSLGASLMGNLAEDDHDASAPSLDAPRPLPPSSPPMPSAIQEKPPPRPYISRSRSSSNTSILSVLSPTLPSQRSPLGSPISENGNPLSPTIGRASSPLVQRLNSN